MTDEDPLSPARGCLTGTLLGGILWITVLVVLSFAVDWEAVLAIIEEALP